MRQNHNNNLVSLDCVSIDIVKLIVCLLIVFYTGEVDLMAAPELQRNTAAAFVQAETVKGSKVNNLINEKSPYLLQHAFNPVNWYPWGVEAFALAKKESKPIFLSIGYSTCHWCHVMAHESFENQDIADILNRNFISIKVDREERPDLDQMYMAATLAMTGSSGWPMSVFLTPERKPFFAGTYFPPEARYGSPGFPEILHAINVAWKQDRTRVEIQAQKIIDHLRQQVDERISDEEIVDKDVKGAVDFFVEHFDKKNGGFGNYPKFPRPVVINLLLRYSQRDDQNTARQIALETLKKMSMSGIYDHLGGGFHRYAVDAAWRVPHFEKMLYDQAQLVASYLDAYQITGDRSFEDTARSTLDYVLRQMSDPDGGFYSAEDADSPLPEDPAKKGEGAFFLWRKSEIYEFLPKDQADLFSFIYGIKDQGNAPADPHGYFSGKNILYQAESNLSASRKFNLSVQQVSALQLEAKDKLLLARKQRSRPHLDDKVLSSWNGLMISAFAKGFHVLREKRYLSAAKKAAEFIYKQMYDQNSKILLHRYRNGHAGIDGQLDDYVFMAQAALDLYEASFDNKWLLWAMELTSKQSELFAVKEHGGFYDNSGKDKTVLLRMKSDYDGSEPAGNSIAAMNLLRLARMTGDDAYLIEGRRTIYAFTDQLKQVPEAMPQMFAAYEFMREKSMQIVIAGKIGSNDTHAMHEVTGKYYRPNKIIMLANLEKLPPEQVKKMEFLMLMSMIDNKATAYVCENFTCKQPTVDPSVLSTMLAK